MNQEGPSRVVGIGCRVFVIDRDELMSRRKCG